MLPVFMKEQHSFEHLNQYEQQIYRDAPRAEEQQKKNFSIGKRTNEESDRGKNHSIDFACFDPLFRYLILLVNM